MMSQNISRGSESGLRDVRRTFPGDEPFLDCDQVLELALHFDQLEGRRAAAGEMGKERRKVSTTHGTKRRLTTHLIITPLVAPPAMPLSVVFHHFF